MLASSGGMKAECINDATGAPATVAVAFLNGRGGDYKEICFKKPVEVADADVFRVTRTNRQGSSMDLYSTIVGTQL